MMCSGVFRVVKSFFRVFLVGFRLCFWILWNASGFDLNKLLGILYSGP